MEYKNCSECQKILKSMAKGEAQRGVGLRNGHILTTAKGDCPHAWQ